MEADDIKYADNVSEEKLDEPIMGEQPKNGINFL
jgi:hypothetical protein